MRGRTRRSQFARLAILGCLISAGGAAHGQVNVEAVRGDARKQGFSGRSEAEATAQTGNTEGVVAGASGRLQVRTGPHLAFLYGSGNYAQFGGKTSVERALGHLRYNHEIASMLWAEAFAQVEHNKFQRLVSREILGAGPRIGLHEDDDINLFYGTSYIAEWENLDLAPGDDDDDSTLSHRWSHYVTASVDLDERLSTGTTFYVQPRFDRFEDFRVLNETYFEVAITEVIATKVSTWMRYDSEPPNAVQRLDTRLQNAFVVRF